MRRPFAGLGSRLRDALLRREADRDMDDELRFHVEMETEKHMRAGLEPAAARRRALAAFGGVERHREKLREGRRVPVLEPLWHDLRFGVRSIARDPVLSAVATLTIALGIGATTTVFSAANALLLRPLPLPEPDRLATIQERRSGAVSNGIEGMLLPYTRVQEYEAATRDLFTAFAAHRLEDGFALRLPATTFSVNGALTTGNYFQTLGVRPALGRAYTSDDAHEVVISHGLWASRFSSDPAAVGRSIGVDGQTVTIVGVAPAGFGGATLVANEIWVPVRLRPVPETSWNVRMVPIGRLRDGVSIETAAAAVDALSKRIPPEQSTTVHGARLDPVALVPSEGRGYALGFFGMLLGAALFVLLIAAANIAGIMVARGLARRREMAVRLALGAGRARVVRHLLAESLMIFGAGGVLGLCIAHLGARWLAGTELPPQIPPILLGFSLDGQVLAFTALVTGATGVVFGLVPALGSSQPDLVPALKTGSAGSVGGSGRMRDAFVVAQVAMAVMLLLAATLFVRSLTRGLGADLGFDPDGVVAASVRVGSDAYDRERGRAFQATLAERVRALPGVVAVGQSQYVLLSGSRSGGDVHRAEEPSEPGVNASFSSVSPGFLHAMRIPVEEGRDLTLRDAEGARSVAVVNRAFAERMWPGRSAIGRQFIGWGGDPIEVVGVTGTGKYISVTEEPMPFVFTPYLQRYQAQMSILARAPGREAETIRAIADIVRSLDPDIAIATPLPVRALIGSSLFPQRFAAQLIGAFGLVGLVLAALGVYGVLAYRVARRTRELGVRRALGATARNVVGTVLRQGAFLAALGCTIGVVLGAGLALLARSFLYGIRAIDPATFVGVPLVLFAVALLASWIPARRAAAVEAGAALRIE